MVFGTGLGDQQFFIAQVSIPYTEIPHFPVSTVPGHQGELLIGEYRETPVIVLSGRFHYYEGYSMKDVTFPVRVLKELGIDTLIITNVAGSTNPNFQKGNLVLVRDHINLLPENPLRGSNDERLGRDFQTCWKHMIPS